MKYKPGFWVLVFLVIALGMFLMRQREGLCAPDPDLAALQAACIAEGGQWDVFTQQCICKNGTL